MKHDYKLSCLSDHDWKQYEFVRNSRLRPEDFGDGPWWKPSQDGIVFWIVVIVGIAAIVWSH
jgi:hypothetical protein